MAAKYVGCAPQHHPPHGRARSEVRPETPPGQGQRRTGAGQEHPQRGEEGAILAGGGLGAWNGCFPEKYARRGPDVITLEQIGLLLTKFAEIIIQEVPERYRSGILKKMDATARSLGIATETGGRRRCALTSRHRWPSWPQETDTLQPGVGMCRDDLARQHGQARRLARRGQGGRSICWPGGRNICPTISAARRRTCTAGWPSNSTHAHTARGTKINVLGPRGGAKSTIGTLAFPFRAALECWEPYIWIVSDTKHQACAHLENIKAELLDNPRLARRLSRGRRAEGRSGEQRDRAPQRRDDRGLRHRPADPRPPPPRTIAPR